MTPDPMAARDAALYRFRAAYGRLCLLMAQALLSKINAADVIAAGQGKGDNHHLQLRCVRDQRRAVNRALTAAKNAGVPRGQILMAGRDAKKAMEGEYALDIPMTAPQA